MYPLGTSLLIGFAVGIMALGGVYKLFNQWWIGFIAGGAIFALFVIGSMLNNEAIAFTSCGISFALLLIALIKMKITKG